MCVTELQTQPEQARMDVLLFAGPHEKVLSWSTTVTSCKQRGVISHCGRLRRVP